MLKAIAPDTCRPGIMKTVPTVYTLLLNTMNSFWPNILLDIKAIQIWNYMKVSLYLSSSYCSPLEQKTVLSHSTVPSKIKSNGNKSSLGLLILENPIQRTAIPTKCAKLKEIEYNTYDTADRTFISDFIFVFRHFLL